MHSVKCKKKKNNCNEQLNWKKVGGTQNSELMLELSKNDYNSVQEFMQTGSTYAAALLTTKLGMMKVKAETEVAK